MNDETFRWSYQRIQPFTLVPPERCWTLWQLAKQAAQLECEIWECGVYKGGTAALIADAIRDSGRTLRIFDTFTGIPFKDDIDAHPVGAFAYDDIEAVRKLARYDKLFIHKGVIPDAFAGMDDSRISFCHVDVDAYRSVVACCEFVWPRLAAGGFIVFDDYGCPACKGAKQAVDEFFKGRAYPILATGAPSTHSAIVFKSRPT